MCIKYERLVRRVKGPEVKVRGDNWVGKETAITIDSNRHLQYRQLDVFFSVVCGSCFGCVLGLGVC